MTHSRRLPPWLRVRLPAASDAAVIRSSTYTKGLPTVCKEARCPNQGECSARGTATFLILGDRCTRTCTFCAVRHGTPGPVRPDEPELVAQSIAALRLRHAVVTSVTRDDLPDGGATAFASTIRAIREKSPGTTIEVLIPDFQGSETALRTVMDASPEVINHNLETVQRLYPQVRPGASYLRSLRLLSLVKERAPSSMTKSGIMLGFGETRSEVLRLIGDLVLAGCTVLTIGQYLQPTTEHHPVVRFLPPEEFDELRDMAQSLGIQRIAAGPLVRSSYMAENFVMAGGDD
jgi:lipoyl synthase